MRRNKSNRTLGAPRLPSASRFEHEFFLTAQQLRLRIEPGKQLTQAGDDNRRGHKRVLRSISVSVQPLDDDFQPCESIFWVVSRDISTLGMGLITHEPITHRYVRLGLMDQATTAIAQVRHNTAIGGKYPLYLVGVEFEGKLMDDDGNLSQVN